MSELANQDDKYSDYDEDLLEFFQRAIALPGKSPISMAILVQSEARRLERRSFIMLTQRAIESSGLSPASAYRGLDELEKHGLVDVKRTRGHSPLVSISSTDSVVQQGE